MKTARNKNQGRYRGIFSLAEAIVAMTIGSMVIVAVLQVYQRTQSAAAAVTEKLDSSRLPDEVLQRIAQDLDGVFDSEEGSVKLSCQSKYDAAGYSTARLVIEKSFYGSDKQAEPKTLEKIVWQTDYDWESDANGLVLYRSRSGVGAEDKLLDQYKEDWQRELFVPMAEGVTCFRVQVPVGRRLQDEWDRKNLPRGLVITISFAEPFQTQAGALEVPEDKKIKRIIALDRTRKIRFIYVPKKYQQQDKDQDETEDEEDLEEEQTQDANDANDQDATEMNPKPGTPRRGRD